jgi:cyclic 2,3-diphosphoglycerate synthase
MRVIALVDGEHHPSVVRDALATLAAEHEIVEVLFVGGEEKVPAEELAQAGKHYGYDLIVGTDIPDVEADAVFDLSGAPVLDTNARRLMALAALGRGLEYVAPGVRVRPPPAERIDTAVPILAVTGSGKRTGKTALGGHLAALLRARGARPVIVSMGRGGPREPQLAGSGERLDVGRLLEIARGGSHAASDYLEDAVLSGVPAVGTRRCGEGPAGEVFDSNVADGVRLALTLDPDVVVLEGSGASLPPVAADRTVCITRGEGEAFAGLGPLRLMRSDLVVLLGQRLPELAEWTRAPVIACRLEPEPAEPVEPTRRVAVFTTAPPEAAYAVRASLARHGFEVVLLSNNLARRADLQRDLDAAVRERCDVFLTELKAAAIDTVAERAAREGVRTVPLRNEILPMPGELDLDDELWRLYEEVAAGVSR